MPDKTQIANLYPFHAICLQRMSEYLDKKEKLQEYLKYADYCSQSQMNKGTFHYY